MHVHPHLLDLLEVALRQSPHRELLGTRRSQGWTWFSPEETAAAINEMAAGLIAHGIELGDSVGILAENRPEWVFADFATLSVGASDVPLYTTLPAEQVAFILADAGARALFVSNHDHVARLAPVRLDLPRLEHLFCFEEGVEGTTSLALLRAKGRELLRQRPSAVAERTAQVRPDTLATLIYTSGTTGTPKGVMLTHANFCHNAGAVLEHLQFTFNAGDRAISFLPLSHATERLVSYAYLQIGMSVGYVPSLERIVDACQELHPNVFVAVPGVLALVRSRVMARLGKEKPWKRRLLHRMLDWGQQEAQRFATLTPLPLWRKLRWAVCDRLLFRALRARLGGRLRAMIVGGAALPVDLCRFFWGIGLPVVEGYGLTETSPVLCINTRGATRFGSVGRAIPEVEIKIADDGEVLAKGPNVMRGYWNRPDDSAAVLRNGYFHTGDLGKLDADGFLQITGRKKEILVLSTGKNVPPRVVEDALAGSPYIKLAIAFGDNRPSVAVLLVPDLVELGQWAKEHGLGSLDQDQLLSDQRVVKLYDGELARLQQRLADFERARRYQFLLEEPSEANGMLTPTRKVRRAAVLARHPALVERLFS